MGKKRAYKSRKSGGGRKKLKPEYDAGKNLKEQMERACEKTKVFSCVLLLMVIIIVILHKKGYNSPYPIRMLL